jgi:hypothetical protein
MAPLLVGSLVCSVSSLLLVLRAIGGLPGSGGVCHDRLDGRGASGHAETADAGGVTHSGHGCSRSATTVATNNVTDSTNSPAAHHSRSST